MSLPQQPKLRRLDTFPVTQADGQVVFALRDPQGFGQSVVLPYPAAVLTALMDGNRTIAELARDYSKQTGQEVSGEEVEQLVRQLDERYLLDTERFRTLWKSEVEQYLNNRIRPAAHAGAAYPADAQSLAAMLDQLFAGAHDDVPKQLLDAISTGLTLSGLMCPQVDFARGAREYAAAYRVVRDHCAAERFVILASAHEPLHDLFSLTRKDFNTPLGMVETDRQFAARLGRNLAGQTGGKEMNLAADELAHRPEHAIEFQAVLLESLFGGRRPFKIVPILIGSFRDFVARGERPSESPQVSAFITALRQTIADSQGETLLIASVDVSHVGQRYGDREFLNTEKLKTLAARDQKLLGLAYSGQADGLFDEVAENQDQTRLNGLPAIYTLLEAIAPARGVSLRYGQAVESDGSACVSFASAAFYGAKASAVK